MYLNESVKDINASLGNIKTLKKIAVWGIGEYALNLVKYSDLLKLDIAFFVNNAPHIKQFCGKEVKSPDEILWEEIGAVIVASFYQYTEIRKELLEKYNFKGKIVNFEEDSAEKLFYEHMAREEVQPSFGHMKLLERNHIFHQLHKKERVFILACGPSVNQMDLSVLKNEYTIALNNFYLHKDCSNLSCNYYCSPRMTTYYEEEYIQRWAENVKKTLPNAKVFMDVKDKDMVAKVINNNFFFVSNEISPDCAYYEEIDLTQKIMAPWSASVMCIQVALYMGFSEIYLIGTEHDLVYTGKYSHFYAYNEECSSKEEKSDGTFDVPYKNILHSHAMLWKQYELMDKLAVKKNAKIYNATVGGALDVFERADFKELFKNM